MDIIRIVETPGDEGYEDILVRVKNSGIGRLAIRTMTIVTERVEDENEWLFKISDLGEAHTAKGTISRSKNDMVRRRIITHTLMSKKRNMKLLKCLGISKKVVQKMIKINRETKWQEFRKRRQDAVSGDDKKVVKDFYHHYSLMLRTCW